MSQIYCLKCDMWHEPEEHGSSCEGSSPHSSMENSTECKKTKREKKSWLFMESEVKTKLFMWVAVAAAILFAFAAVAPHMAWHKNVGPVTDNGAKIDALGAKLDSVQKSVNDKNHNEIMTSLHKLEDQGIKLSPNPLGNDYTREELVQKICKETGCTEADAYKQLGSLEHGARVSSENTLKDTNAKLHEIQQNSEENPNNP